MPISRFEFEEMQRRVKKTATHEPQCAPETREVGRGALHEKILAYCDSQWPRWVVIHSRTDMRPTIAQGVCDFIIALPGKRTAYVEAKAAGKKLSPEQRIFEATLSSLGHKLIVVYSIAEFDLKMKLFLQETAHSGGS